MWSAPIHGTRGTKSAVACDSLSTTADYFCKGERRIQVGDCVFFKSPQDSPHFVGLIRRLSSNEEENLSVSVNKLYRPIELKLGKGILLDAVPNEVFYSFHRHEIPAASLLHPCKVAFLPEGVTLPSGTSSFVCRRVFDTDNRCLQWLTDQEYIDERQQEVEQLLYKSIIEMHATIQSSSRSPKPINGPKPTSQLKSGSDNVQTTTSLLSQAKEKKRDRTDQGFEPVKRERSLKADDCDSAQYRSESILKFEISRITEKGGLVNSEGVEKLVQIMQSNRVEKKLELVSRSIFAGVIAATENFDCLSRFVQIKGLLLFDQWLQDVHKGKVGEGSPKDGDKSIEEFLFILLRALDKLPVNLQALQMCHIGKSVNHLRTYKNSEIQKKARSLVDTWKKRVEAEMNVIDTKCGSNQAVSWTSRSRLPEGSHGGPSEAAMKSSTQSSAAKIDSIQPVQADMSAKYAISSPGLTKLAPSPGKDGEPRSVVGSNPDLPSNNARDERSSSSSHSHNSRSSSSDHAKATGFLGKEDARSSTARSISVNKVSRGSSRPRRSVNGHLQTAPSASPRETGSSRNSSFQRNLASEKLSQSGLTCEKALDLPSTDGSSHKLIVKIPNGGSSPSQCIDVGPVEDPTVMNSRDSSPVLSEKNDESDPNSMEKADVETTSDVKTESWQSNDFKDILTGSDEGDGSPNSNDDEKLAEASEAVSHSLGNELKLEKLHDASYDSINALIESCVKYSHVNPSISGGDDGGMNLLASVAAGEMSKSDMPSPDGSSGRTSNIRDNTGMGDDSRSNAPDGNDVVQEQCRSEVGFHGTTKQENPISVIPEQAAEDEAHNSFKLESKIAVKLGSQFDDLSYEVKDVAATFKNCAAGEMLTGYESKQPDEKVETNIEATKLKCSSLLINDKTYGISVCCKVKREASIGVPSNAFLDADCENKADVREASKDGSYTEQKPSMEVKFDTREGCNGLNKDFLLRSACKSEGVKLESSEFEDRMTCNEADESNESESSATKSVDETSHVNKKPKFDLNEGFSLEDGQLGESMTSEDTRFPVSAHIVSPLPFTLASKLSGGLSTPITVAAAAKGAFVPSFDLLRSKRDGWKGSAATSAFRPAEPRKALEMPPVVAIKQNRSVLDFDLNVADETSVEDVASIGLDLDLNRVEESGDKWQGSSSSGRGSEAFLFPAKSRSLHGYPISESKKFDLNNGPVFDEAVEPSLHNKHSRSNVQSQHFFTGLRTSAQETKTFSSWFPGGNPLPPVTLTPILSDRGDQPFPIVATNGPPRVLGPTGPMPFSPDLYRESMLSSSPSTVPFPSFQYPVFPFGTGFPLPSASLSTFKDPLSNGRLGFAASNAQSLSGPSPLAVASHFSRPYFVSLPDGGNNTSVGNNRQWGRQGLDLNAGPLTLETECMDESLPLVSRQLSVASSRPLADEQGRMFQQAAGSLLKTKENNDNFRHKQPSWQY